MLNEGEWLSNHYQLIKSNAELDMAEDYLIVKQSLVESIADNHPAFPGELTDGYLDSALAFLRQFNNVYTTNYDLLPYWASLRDDTFPFSDGFGREFDTDHRYCVFLPTEATIIRYISSMVLSTYTQLKARFARWYGIPLANP